MKKFYLAALLLFIVGCSSSPSPVLPPVALTPIENPLAIERVWRLKAGEGVSEYYLKLRPVFKADSGYLVDYKGNLVSFKLKTGRINWQKALSVPAAGGLTLNNGKLFFGTSKGEVIALDSKDGSLLWRSQLSSEILARVAVKDDMLVAKTIDGRVYGLDKTSGKRRWIFDRTVPRLTLRGSSTPIIVNDIVITASDSGKLVALTLATGKLLWETTISIPQGRSQLERIIDLDIDPFIVDDVIYIAGYQGRIAAVKLGSGQLIWSRDFSTWSGLYVDAYRVYVTDAEGRVWALNRYNGATLWRQDKLLRRQLTAPQTYDNYIVLGDYDGYLHWLNREDGKIAGRKRIDEVDPVFNQEDESEEDRMLFSKWNNILVRPLLVEGILLSLDRTGRLEAFKLAGK